MAIFEDINEDAEGIVHVPKRDAYWVALGVEFLQAKEKDGIKASDFARSKGINYSTFTSSMSRYSSKIDLAISANKLKKKSPKSLSKKERATLMVNAYRASLRSNIKTGGGAKGNNKSIKWFQDTMKSVRSHKVTTPVPGKIYAFVYDAKYKDTLPFWDKYPLIIFLGTNKNLFHGLNLHYIPPKARQQMLEELLVRYSSTPTISNKTKLRVKWQDVKGFFGAQQMIKAYLPQNVKGTFIEIKPTDWANVTLLPTQQFVSKGKRYSSAKVWGHAK